MYDYDNLLSKVRTGVGGLGALFLDLCSDIHFKTSLFTVHSVMAVETSLRLLLVRISFAKSPYYKRY